MGEWNPMQVEHDQPLDVISLDLLLDREMEREMLEDEQSDSD